MIWRPISRQGDELCPRLGSVLVMLCLHGNGRSKSKLHWRAGHGGPHDQGLSADLIGRGGACRAGSAWERDGHRDAARIAFRLECDRLDLGTIIVVVVAKFGFALIESHAIDENARNLVLWKGDDRPVGQPVHFLSDDLDPGFNKRHLSRLRSNRNLGLIVFLQVGLVEHVRIVMKTQEISSVCHLCVLEECVEISIATRSLDPLPGGAFGGVAIVINGRSPSRNDDEAIVAIILDVADARPKLADRVAQWGSSVVANDRRDAILHPSPDDVAIVKPGNGRRDDTVG